MLRRLASVLIILVMIMETGCAKRVPVDVYPIRRPSDRVKAQDKVTAVLREEINLKGTAGIDSLMMEPVEWQTLEVTGRLVKWDERHITIRVVDWKPGEDAVFEIPIDQIDQIDEWPGFKPGPVLSAIGGLAIVVGVTFLLVWALSKP